MAWQDDWNAWQEVKVATWPSIATYANPVYLVAVGLHFPNTDSEWPKYSQSVRLNVNLQNNF